MRKRISRLFIFISILFVLSLAAEGDGVLSVFTPHQAYASEESQAVDKAKSYISAIPFSREGLIRQLEFSGFTHSAAEYAADNCGADWNDQAVKKAESYLQVLEFSEDGLLRQLEKGDYFTHDQAVYALETVSPNVDWNEQAVKKAESYLQVLAFSEEGLRRQLENGEFFTHEQADYAIKAISPNIDWNEQAVKMADSYLGFMAFTRKDLINQLEKGEYFTHEQAVYGVDHAAASFEDMIKILTLNVDNIFPIRSMEDIFTNPIPAAYSDVGPSTAVLTSNQDGMRNISLYANPDSVHDYNSVTKLSAGNLKNFLLTMDVRVNDIYPSKQGGCFIGYTNESPSGNQTEAIKTVGLLVDGEGAEFYVKGKEDDSGEHFNVSGGKRKTHTLTLIRLTGQTYAYIDGSFAGQYYDEGSGPFQLVYGAALFNEGDLAECSFDNLIVRKVVN